MDTAISIEVLGPPGSDACHDEVERAFGWFAEVEAHCSRFDPASELMLLCSRPGEAVQVGTLLYSAVDFALAVASATDGAFDPTVGRILEARGFNTNYRTGERIAAAATSTDCSYRDVVLDPHAQTITLLAPLVLDLGAVAKGLAIDLAARQLEQFDSFAINAGGDLFFHGGNSAREPWSVGIRHPRELDTIIDTLCVSDAAVCTSGDYERTDPGGGGHHIVDPRDGVSAAGAISVTVVAPTAMVADALATAAFVLGPDQGVALLERFGVEGMLLSNTLTRHATAGFQRYRR